MAIDLMPVSLFLPFPHHPGPLTIPSTREPATVDVPQPSPVVLAAQPAPAPRPVVLSPASIPIPGFSTHDDATLSAENEGLGDSASPASALHPGTDASTVTGFVCVSCNTHNLLRPAKETWYVVSVGRQVGVFQGMYVMTSLLHEHVQAIDGNFAPRHHVQPLVSGARGACYRKYRSREEALAAFQDALDQGVLACVD